MFNIERQNEILNMLTQHKSISVNKLSKLLYVSPPTIRRDLSALEKQGKVCRTHGGVVLRQTSECEIPLMYRESQNSMPKQIIAKKAAEHIKDGDVIFLDASSTVAHIIPYLKSFNDIIVVTNSPKTSIKLGEEDIKNYCTGGLLLRHSIAYVGNDAEKFISNINANLFFFSSRGYLEDGCITDSSIEESTIKKAMIKNAEKSFYLCDSSKKGKKYMFNICSTKDVTGIINELDE
ncbi:MAG: DeoR/GlpR transcriptional regulator [Clostridia bacterium]|nr:DeoR/GlpR transcriptional regulator [Clostridia bacterium]